MTSLLQVVKNTEILGKALLTSVFASFSSPLFANGLRLVSQDAFATARGEAFVATADNPSAIYYNPAGLTQLDGDNFRGGIYGLNFNPSFRPPAGAANSDRTFRIRNNDAAVPQLFFSRTFDTAPLSIGVGLYSPHGAAVAWPDEASSPTGFRSIATEGELTYLRFNPVIAYKVTPSLSIAGGLLIDYGDIRLEQGLQEFVTPANNFRFEGDDLSLSYNIGLLWQPHEKLSFGATLRSSTTLDFQGQTEIIDQVTPGLGSTVSTPASLEYDFPLTTVFGVSYRPTSKWNIEFNADFTEWSSFDRSTIRQAQSPAFGFQQDIDVNLGFKDSWIYSFGVTRYFNNGWRASVGYTFNENSVSDTFFNPLISDLDRHFLSIGVGKKGKRFDFDASYQFGFSPSRTVSGSIPSSIPGSFINQSADGTYDFTSHALFLSFGMKF